MKIDAKMVGAMGRGKLPLGDCYALEELATQIIMDARSDITAISEKNDILSPDQLELREKREVHNGRGYPDPSIAQGLFRRAYNPNFGRRPTGRRRNSLPQDPYHQDLHEQDYRGGDRLQEDD